MSEMELCVETGEDGVPFVQLGQHKLRLDLEDLDEEFLERSRVELRETPEVVEESLARFKTLLEGKLVNKNYENGTCCPSIDIRYTYFLI